MCCMNKVDIDLKLRIAVRACPRCMWLLYTGLLIWVCVFLFGSVLSLRHTNAVLIADRPEFLTYNYIIVLFFTTGGVGAPLGFMAVVIEWQFVHPQAWSGFFRCWCSWSWSLPHTLSLLLSVLQGSDVSMIQGLMGHRIIKAPQNIGRRIRSRFFWFQL